jgi:3-oxoacyl-[acyl-carrier protein] reductase
MDLGLRGKTALVLGGGRGLGRGVADALAAEGVAIALLSREQAAIDTAAREISTAHGVPAFGVSADLADWSTLERALATAHERLGGRIDILLNNSGGPPPAGVLGVSAEQWLKQFQAMVLSLMRVTEQVLPGMRARRWGRILTIASSTVVEPIPTLGVSNTLRSTLVGWSKSLAGEVAREGITVNLLLPGRIATARVAQLDARAAERENISTEAVAQRAADNIPAGRYGTPAEFGAVAAFLASEPAAYITGSMIRVDGGLLRSV